MPDREITFDQSKEIVNWITKIKGGRLVVYIPTFDNRIPGTGVYEIEGEPLLLHGWIGTRYQARILSSDKHAQELEQAGIVDFGLAKPSDAQVANAVSGALESLNQ